MPDQRPLFVTAEAPNRSRWTLADFLDAADQYRNSQQQDPALARSQLRRLAGQLDQGRKWTEYLFKRLPKELREALEQNAQIDHKSLWDVHGPGRYLTRFKDLVELIELAEKVAEVDQDQDRGEKE